MALRVVIALLLIAGLVCADARQVRMTVGENVETFDLSVVTKIEFGSPLTGTAEPAPAPQQSAAPPNVEKAPEIPVNPFTRVPGGASNTPEPKPQQPNQP